MSEKKASPFDFVDSVSHTKVDLIAGGRPEGDYSPFLTNRSLSYHSDAVLHANEMNLWRGLDGRLQYDYLRGSLRRRSRRSGWSRPDDREAVELVGWAYGLGSQKAREALRLLDADHVEKLNQQRKGMFKK